MSSATATHDPALCAQVPFTRMDCADPALLEELLGAVREVAEHGAFTLGHHVEEFEREFAAYCESDFAVGVSSGTEALVLALRALQIGPGDEVVLPTNSFIATAEAVSAVGAVPVPVDVDPDSHLLTAELVAAGLGPRVRCVIPVHLYGATVDMDPILELAREAGIHVLEDACQAHGARYHGRRVGTLGTLGCFSFYPAKNLGAWGDGGAVVTSRPELADRVRLLRAHGERPRYHHRLVGSTARLDALQAAVLRRKLTRLDGWNDERRWLAAELRARITTAGARAAGAAHRAAVGARITEAWEGRAAVTRVADSDVPAAGAGGPAAGAAQGQAGAGGAWGPAVGEGRRAWQRTAGNAGDPAADSARLLLPGVGAVDPAVPPLPGAGAVDPVHPPFLGADHVHHLFVVRCEQRDALRRHLTERGVASGIHYPVPIHRTAAYAGLGLGPESLPVSEALAERICSLPMFPGMSAAELQQVAKAVASFIATGTSTPNALSVPDDTSTLSKDGVTPRR